MTSPLRRIGFFLGIAAGAATSICLADLQGNRSRLKRLQSDPWEAAQSRPSSLCNELSRQLNEQLKMYSTQLSIQSHSVEHARRTSQTEEIQRQMNKTMQEFQIVYQRFKQNCGSST